jgi:transposase
MRGFELNTETVKELKDAHRTTRDKRHADRIKAVVLLGTGWTLEEASEALLLDSETLRKYVSRYRKFGLSGLLKLNNKGRPSFLSETQLQQLQAYLDNSICMTTQEAIEFVARKFSVKYTVSGMNDLLHRLGYVYKKPAVVPGKADAYAQLKFLEDFNHLSDGLKSNDALYFMDASHPTHNTKPAYGWIKKGERREVKTNSGRQRLNINGAINVHNMDMQYRFEDTINSGATIELFKRIENANPCADTIYIVLDNARYHHSKEVKAYLKESKICPLYLPPYSPNLNLIERLWKFFNKQILYNKYYEKFEQFKQAAHTFFGEMTKYIDELRSLLTENFQIIGVKQNS